MVILQVGVQPTSMVRYNIHILHQLHIKEVMLLKNLEINIINSYVAAQ